MRIRPVNRSESIALVCVFAFIVSFLALMAFTPGCTTVPGPDGTNTVTVIDPVKLARVETILEPGVASVLRRALARSPQHGPEIANYARAFGGVFCQAQQNQQFSPDIILAAADAATMPLQTNAPPELIDGKNMALALYRLLWNDKLTVSVPTNGWPYAVCTLFCNSVDRGLKDAGYPGVK